MVFSFGGSAVYFSGRWRGYNADSVLRKLFFGEEKDFAKPRLNFARAQEGLGEEGEFKNLMPLFQYPGKNFIRRQIVKRFPRSIVEFVLN